MITCVLLAVFDSPEAANFHFGLHAGALEGSCMCRPIIGYKACDGGRGARRLQ